MQTKNQLQKLNQRYITHIESLPTRDKIRSFKISLIDAKRGTVAHCTISKHKKEESWNIGDTRTKIRGIGKLLYYSAMNFIYPEYLGADMCGCSNKAIRLWQTLEKVDYVDYYFADVPHWELNEAENDNYSSIRCRFAWYK